MGYVVGTTTTVLVSRNCEMKGEKWKSTAEVIY
jgi:hypothetical protein